MPDPEDDDAAFDGAAAGLAGDCANAGIANALTNRTVVSVDMLRFMASPSPDGPLSRNPVLDFEFPPHDKTKGLLSARLSLSHRFEFVRLASQSRSYLGSDDHPFESARQRFGQAALSAILVFDRLTKRLSHAVQFTTSQRPLQLWPGGGAGCWRTTTGQHPPTHYEPMRRQTVSRVRQNDPIALA